MTTGESTETQPKPPGWMPETLSAVREMADEVAVLKQAVAEPLADTLAQFLTVQYVVATKAAVRKTGGKPLDLTILRGLSSEVVALRRGDHYAERLRLERERLEMDCQQTKDRLEKLFWEWAARPENKDKICGSLMTPKQKAQRIREIYGRAPLETEPEEPEESSDPATLI